MTFPLYLRILLPLTLAVCGYTMWSKSSSKLTESIVSGSITKRVKAANNRIPATATTPPLVSHNLFPDQGISAGISETADDHIGLPQLVKPVIKKLEPPRPPALPFQIIGVWSDGFTRKIILQNNHSNNEVIVLSDGEDKNDNPSTSHIPRIGDILSRDYRLEQIEKNHITFMYLPLQVTQTLTLE